LSTSHTKCGPYSASSTKLGSQWTHGTGRVKTLARIGEIRPEKVHKALEPVWDLLNEGLRGYFSVRRSRKIIA